MVTLKNCPIKMKTKQRIIKNKMTARELKKRLAELPSEEDINWICTKCGEARYHRKVGCATWHKDICDVCKTYQMVTEPRDFIRGDKIMNTKVVTKIYKL